MPRASKSGSEKSLKIRSTKNIVFSSILMSLWGSKWSPKSIKNRSFFKQGFQRVPGVDFDRILDQFWSYFGMIFRRFLDVYECSDSLCLEGF